MAITAADGSWSAQTAWPWPRIWVLPNHVVAVTLAGTDLCLYELASDADVITATKVATLGAAATYGYVDIAAFGKYYLVSVSNADNTAVRCFARLPGAVSGMTAVKELSGVTTPLGGCVCNYRQQLLVSGIANSGVGWEDLTTTTMVYSAIGSIECRASEATDAGFIPIEQYMHGCRQIMRIVPLGEFVVIYTDVGTLLLRPVKVGDITGFGYYRHYDVCLAAKQLLVIGGQQHLFINTKGSLSRLSVDGLEDLDYTRQVALLTQTDTLLSWDAQEDTCYIADGVYSLGLTKHGLFTTHQCPTSIGIFNGVQTGFFKTNYDEVFRLRTLAQDFGDAGLKTVENVEFELSTDVEVPFYGTLELAATYQNVFATLPDVPLNPLGIVTQKGTARFFRCLLHGEFVNDAQVRLGGLVAKVKFCDRRHRRGTRNVS